MDKRQQHRTMLKEIAAGSTRFVFHSRKLTDDQSRNCQFCGNLFLPGEQPGIEAPYGPAHWRRTLCSDECQSLRHAMRIRKKREDAIRVGSTPGIKVDLSTIRERDGYVCYLCGGQTEKGYKGTDRRLRSETDHVVPLSNGGAHHPDNLRCCCARCNSEKGTKTLVEAIRISSCGDIDFNDLSLVGTPPNLDELISAWRQWVIPGIDDDAEERGYADHEREKRWSSIYLKRIARLEESTAREPDAERPFDNLTLGYIGIAKFLKQYGRNSEAIMFQRRRLTVEERLALASPARIKWLDIASCLFDLAELGADARPELVRLAEILTNEAMNYIYHAIVHMQQVADRRAAQRTARLGA
jgi:5-methylcytosine-specific restriction endonuclease McrA